MAGLILAGFCIYYIVLWLAVEGFFLLQIQYGVSQYTAHCLVVAIAPSGMGKTQIKDFVNKAALRASQVMAAWAKDGMRLSGAMLGSEGGEMRFLADPQTYVRVFQFSRGGMMRFTSI